MLLRHRWSALFLLLCLGLLGWLPSAKAATCLQYGGTSVCYEPSPVYIGKTSWGANGVYTYASAPYSSVMAAATDVASFVINNAQASQNDGCSSPLTSQPSSFMTCANGVLTGNVSTWWQGPPMYCLGNACSLTTANADVTPVIGPNALSTTVFAWGAKGAPWYANGPNSTPYQPYTFSSVGGVTKTAYCNAGDSLVTDQDSAGYYHFLCKVAPVSSAAGASLSASDGNENCRVCSAHPVDLIADAKVDYVQDLVIDAPFPIVWDRTYTQGMGWHFGYDRHMDIGGPDSSGNVVVMATRENGSVLTFSGVLSGSNYTWTLKGAGTAGSSVSNGAYATSTLSTTLNGAGAIQTFSLANALDQVEVYDGAGQLQTITDRQGHVLTFTEGANGKVTTVKDAYGHTLTITYPVNAQSVTYAYTAGSNPNGVGATGQGLQWANAVANLAEQWPTQVTDGHQAVQYGYTAVQPSGANAALLLTSITHPDGSALTYTYGELMALSVSHGVATVSPANAPSSGTPPYANTQPTFLTGVLAEDGTRLETVFYQSGYGVTGETRGGTYSPLQFGGNSVTDPAGTNFSFKANGGQQAGGPYQGACPAILCRGMDTRWVSMTYDATGQPTSLQDYVGNTETRLHETIRGLLTSRTEAVNSATPRTTTYTWDSRFRLPDTVTEPIQVNGVAGTRTTTYTYDNQGHVLTQAVAPSSGETPRVTTYTYDSAGIPGHRNRPQRCGHHLPIQRLHGAVARLDGRPGAHVHRGQLHRRRSAPTDGGRQRAGNGRHLRHQRSPHPGASGQRQHPLGNHPDRLPDFRHGLGGSPGDEGWAPTGVHLQPSPVADDQHAERRQRQLARHHHLHPQQPWRRNWGDVAGRHRHHPPSRHLNL